MLRKLRELRHADKGTKLRWVIILSTISTVIIIAIWILALNVITQKIADQKFVRREAPSVKNASDRLKDAFQELKLRTGNALNFFSGALGKNEIELKQPADETDITTSSTP